MFLRRDFFLIGFAAALAAAVATDTPLRWTQGPELLRSGPPGAFDAISVKDPSIVRYDNRWHVFYTARNRTDCKLGYVSAPKLEDLAHARRHSLDQLHGARSKYAAAPQVFYFRPHKKWYLIYQTTDSNYLPVYSSAAAIGNPTSWTAAKTLVHKQDKAKWIDFWVICDDALAYLFFTRNHQEVVVMTTRLADFPDGFSNMRRVFSPVHEAVHVYSLKGSRPGYVMLSEHQDGQLRRFGLARATSLGGPWTLASERFAAGQQLKCPPGQARWTDEVSHGELLRSGWDERLQVPFGQWQFLVQGMLREQHQGEYSLLPWRLGLITARPDPEF